MISATGVIIPDTTRDDHTATASAVPSAIPTARPAAAMPSVHARSGRYTPTFVTTSPNTLTGPGTTIRLRPESEEYSCQATSSASTVQ
jgi:hypothetical protein